jgi:hypothetical protein
MQGHQGAHSCPCSQHWLATACIRQPQLTTAGHSWPHGAGRNWQTFRHGIAHASPLTFLSGTMVNGACNVWITLIAHLNIPTPSNTHVRSPHDQHFTSQSQNARFIAVVTVTVCGRTQGNLALWATLALWAYAEQRWWMAALFTSLYGMQVWCVACSLARSLSRLTLPYISAQL